MELTTKNNKKINFCDCGDPPPQTQAVDVTVLQEDIHTTGQNNNAIIVGDFNSPNVDWSLLAGGQEGSRLIEMMED